MNAMYSQTRWSLQDLLPDPHEPAIQSYLNDLDKLIIELEASKTSLNPTISNEKFLQLAIMILTFSGFMNSPSMIGRRLVMQRNTPREMRGRVNSALFVACDVLFLIGMGAADLADLIDVRILYLILSLLVFFGGVWVLFLPGLRQDVMQWRQAISLLRSAPSAPGLSGGRLVTPADFDGLAGIMPALSALISRERESLIQHGRILDVLPELLLSVTATRAIRRISFFPARRWLVFLH